MTWELKCPALRLVALRTQTFHRSEKWRHIWYRLSKIFEIASALQYITILKFQCIFQITRWILDVILFLVSTKSVAKLLASNTEDRRTYFYWKSKNKIKRRIIDNDWDSPLLERSFHIKYSEIKCTHSTGMTERFLSILLVTLPSLSTNFAFSF